MYMIGVQEYRSVCCGVVDTVAVVIVVATVSTRSTQSTAVSNVDTESTAGVCCGIYRSIYKSICSSSSITVAWHNIQKHNYILYVCIIY